MRATPTSTLTVLLLCGPTALVAQAPTAFEHVNVIPMDTERVLTDQTVLVRDGIIAAMGPAGQVTVPRDAVRVDARDKYLIPGLAEMHAHIPSPQAPTAFTENVLYLYVAAGVTTVRGMLGHPSHLDLRRRVESGALVGPRIWTSGPSVNGNSVSTPDSAVRTAVHQRTVGYDFIKIHPGLTRTVFDSLDASADRAGITFAGHVPVDVGLRRALEARYWSIDHLDGYVESLAGREGDPGGGWFGVNFTDAVDPAQIAPLARATAEAGVWNVPTQTLMESYARARHLEALRARPELRYMPPETRRQWVDFTTNAARQAPPDDVLERWIDVRRRLLKALHDAGAGLALGSDAPQVWNVPGFSVHRELEAMVAAGLTPYQALAIGTRNVARFLGVGDRAGTIAVGNRADLVLLDANPLANITHTTRRAGVMLRGVWMPQAAIQRHLDEIAAGYGN